METKTKLNRNVHGEGHKISPNMHRLVVHLYNPPRRDSVTGRGSKDFKTTHTFKEVKTVALAIEALNQFIENRSDGYISYSKIKKAYYNGECMVSEGSFSKSFLLAHL